jgi:catechol 2,3-dioxygenase-like lactoylglutathione lyase family enzyme
MSADSMKTLGIRHIALNVRDPQISKDFYCRVLRMAVEWEPDSQNVYLTSGGSDNLALHQATPAADSSRPHSQSLDHLGFALPTLESVDEWHDWIKSQGGQIVREIKTHRDGARSFYLQDPDGIVIQMIYHPPIARHESKGNQP